MKPTHAALLAITGLLALLNSPLRAQETPPASLQPEIPLEPTKPVIPVEPAAPQKPLPPREGEKRRGPQRSNEELTAYIGVLTGEVTRELRRHLNLAEGFGLMVHEVMPDTPASVAGLKEDDILVRFEDQKLINADQLQTLVRSKKSGDVVALTVISSGIEKQVNVTIAARLMPVRHEDRLDRHLPPGFRGSFFNGEGRGDFRDTVDRLRNEAREYQERVQESRRDGPTWYRERENRRPGDARRERDRGPRERVREESPAPRENASITRKDESGDYSLRKEGDKNIFSAKQKDGQEQSWNLDNPSEKESIPENLKEKLKQLEEIRGGGKKPTPPAAAPETPKPAESI